MQTITAIIILTLSIFILGIYLYVQITLNKDLKKWEKFRKSQLNNDTEELEQTPHNGPHYN